MIEFWLSAGLLLLVALAFLLLPVVRGRKAQTEEDRTALNVTLYQERLRELENQQQAGVLTDEQLATGRAEAARELLDDTEGAEPVRTRFLGGKIPLTAALLVPLLGYGLYLQLGSIDNVEKTRELIAQSKEPQPQNLAELIVRLETRIKADPKSAQGWYFLGRAYMAQQRSAEAAKAFERSVSLAEREPELLGQWAQALYFAGDKQWTEQIQGLTDEALQADPQELTSLGLLGIAAFESGRFAEAIGFWQRLVAVLPADDPSRAAITGGIERAQANLQGDSGVVPETAPQVAPEAVASAEADSATGAELTVRVELAADVRSQVQATDTVFVFVRATSGPPMPLAVKRLTVADLPAEVSLSDRDAMMPQLKLSGFPQVQLVARVSRAANATSGEWIGRSSPLASSTQETQTLIIDSADGQAR